MNDPRLAGLAARAPALRLTTAPDDLVHYGRDWTRFWTPAPLAIALPATIDEVQTIIAWANAERVAIVPSGGRTGLSGGAVAMHGELVLSLERMHHIVGFDAAGRTLQVEAGVTLHAVQAAAHEHGLQYPVDLAARGSCSIGGNIATNAGGIRVIRYGMTREWIAGLTVIAGSGERLELNRDLVKNATGYDFRHLFIGSEGTLGIVVAASLRLTDPPPPARTLLLALPTMDAVLEAFKLFRTRVRLQAFEFFTDIALRHVVAHGATAPLDGQHPFYVVLDHDAATAAEEQAGLDAFEATMEAGSVADGVMAESHAQAQALWRLREGITESLTEFKPYKNDISLRIAALPAFLGEMQALFAAEYPGIEVVWFGHIGDGNLHINVVPPAGMAQDAFLATCGRVTRHLAEVLQRHGGSISAEHGIGLVKRPYLASSRSAAEIELMRGVKRVFDPKGIMNPGKLFTADGT